MAVDDRTKVFMMKLEQIILGVAIMNHSVEHADGAWSLLSGSDQPHPIRHGGLIVTKFGPGWHPECVYSKFAPILLLELRHESGIPATWYLDRDLNRIGGSFKELNFDTRFLIVDKYLDIIAKSHETSGHALHGHPDEYDDDDDLGKVNRFTLAEIRTAGGLEEEELAKWAIDENIWRNTHTGSLIADLASPGMAKLAMRAVVAARAWSVGIDLGRLYVERLPRDEDICLRLAECLEHGDDPRAALAFLEEAFGDDMLSPDVVARIGRLRMRLGDSPGALSRLEHALNVRASHRRDIYTAYAELAFTASHFEAMLHCFATIRDRVGLMLDSEALSTVSAWMGRASFMLNDMSRAREHFIESISCSPHVPEWLQRFLDLSILYDRSIQFTGIIPDVLVADVRSFANYIITTLKQPAVHSEAPISRYSALVRSAYWIKAASRTIILDEEISACDKMNLVLHGIAPSFLDAARTGPQRVAERCSAHSNDVEFAPDPLLSDRQFDVASTVILRGKPIMCPFTGGRGMVRDSLDRSVYLYRFNAHHCLIVSSDNYMLALSDSAWFLPEYHLLMGTKDSRDSRGHIKLIQSLARVFDNHDAVVAYLGEKDRPIMVSDIAVGHLGHHIWNVISGWSTLFRLVQPENIDIIATSMASQLFGGVKELYPDKLEKIRDVFEYADEDQIFRKILDSKALSVALMDRRVTADLAQRVIRWCESRCSPQFLAEVAAIKQASHPLLLVTIRLENRAWVEQEAGLVEIINKLKADFPSIAIVLDGLNANMHSVDTHSFMSLEGEERLAKQIKESCPAVTIIDSIGCSLAEGIVWCDTVDAFLAPVGAGLAKCRWITNKPGVAYSNETFLTPGDVGGHLYDNHREGSVPMYYIDHNAVTDVETERHGGRYRANFSMAWEVPYLSILDLLSKLPG